MTWREVSSQLRGLHATEGRLSPPALLDMKGIVPKLEASGWRRAVVAVLSSPPLSPVRES